MIRRVCVVLLCVLCSSVGFALAQDSPQPTKTPAAPVPTATAPAPAAADDAPLYLQADLRVLSGNVQRPNGMTFHNGLLYVVCNGDWTIYEIDAATGATQTYLWGVRNAHQLIAETDAVGSLNLWVPDFQTNALVRVYQRATRNVTSGLNGPWGIVALDADHFLVTNMLGNNAVSVSRAGTVREVVRDLRAPAGLAADATHVYVANNGSSSRAIEAYALAALNNGGLYSERDATVVVRGIQSPTGVVLGPDGQLYFAYALGTRGVVGRVDPVACLAQGGCGAEQVSIVAYTDLAAPLAGLAVTPDMRLFVHTIFSPDLYVVQLPQSAAALPRD